MRRFRESVENNTNSQSWGNCSKRVLEFLGYDLSIKKMPETLMVSHFDASMMAKKLSEVKNDPEQESEGNVLTPRMKWVQEQLDEMKLKFFDTTYRNDRSHSSLVTAVPFISDYGKPATFYIASTNQYEEKGKYSCDRLSGVILALALAAQLKESEEYKNVVILFVNQHNLIGAAYLIEEIIQKRYVNVSVGAIVELCYFSGTLPISEAPLGSNSDSIFGKLFDEVGLPGKADPLGYSCLAKRLSEFEYETTQFGSTIDDDLYEELRNKNMDETLYTAESQANFCTTNESKVISNLLYQHAIIVSSYNYYNELDHFYKH